MRATRLPCWTVLLVPGLDVHLTNNLAVAYVKRRRSEHADPIRILACLVERYALLAYNFVLDPVRHCPAADVSQVLGNLLLTAQHVRRAWSAIAVDDEHLGVVSVKTGEEVGIELLDSAAHSLEIEPTGGLLFGHDILLYSHLVQNQHEHTPGWSPAPSPKCVVLSNTRLKPQGGLIAAIHRESEKAHSRKPARDREGTATKSYSYNAGGGSFSTHQ